MTAAEPKPRRALDDPAALARGAAIVRAALARREARKRAT